VNPGISVSAKALIDSAEHIPYRWTQRHQGTDWYKYQTTAQETDHQTGQ